MSNNIKEVNIFEINAGWRNWYYLEIISAEGIKGYSELTESNGPKESLQKITFEIIKKLDLSNYKNTNYINRQLNSFNKQGAGGTISKCIAAINNALIDLNAKSQELSVVDFLGGALREKVPTYWSHCGTTRIRSINHLKNGTSKINSLQDFAKLGSEVTSSEFNTLKTNLMTLDPVEVCMPSYNAQDILSTPSLEKTLKDTSKIINELANDGQNKILLDIGYNLTNSSILNLAQIINNMKLGWLEVDLDNFNSINSFKDILEVPICSGENNVNFLQYFNLIRSKIAEIISIDPSWNSINDILRISQFANFYNQEITLHNHYSNLSTYIGLSIGQLIEKFSFLEVDVDDVAWKDSIIELPKIQDGHFINENYTYGWGFKINWEELNNHLNEVHNLKLS